jgi:hypothetical protein
MSIVRADVWQNTNGVPRQTVLNTWHISPESSATDNTGSFVATPWAITVTPSSVSSRFALWYSAWGQVSQNVTHGIATFYRNSTNLGQAYGMGNFYTASGGYTEFYVAMNFVDSPATTSAITYTIFIRKEGAGSFSLGGGTSRRSSFIIQEIAI